LSQSSEIVLQSFQRFLILNINNTPFEGTKTNFVTKYC